MHPQGVHPSGSASRDGNWCGDELPGIRIRDQRLRSAMAALHLGSQELRELWQMLERLDTPTHDAGDQ